MVSRSAKPKSWSVELFPFRGLARLIAFLALVSPAAAEPTVSVLADAGTVSKIVETRDGVFAVADGRSFRLVRCGAPAGLCPEESEVTGNPARAPVGALPDGGIAAVQSGDIRQAWYADPTDRYGHCVLGDCIEGGSLAVKDINGNPHVVRLPEQQVFEDITPRIADLDGDGTNEVITIRSSATGGAAIVLYGLRQGRLVELGAAREIGTANRWLNVAAILPNGAKPAGGVLAVRTPHIGGRLFSVGWDGRRLTEQDGLATDVSNHVIGSRVLSLSALVPIRGRLELVLPSQDRRRLRFPLTGMADIDLPARIDRAMAIVGGLIVTATEDGRLLVIDPGIRD